MLERLEVITPGEPVITVGAARKQCRVSHTYDDADLLEYILSATEHLQNYLDRSFATQQLRYTVSQTAPANSFPLQIQPVFVLPLAWEWNLLHQTQTVLELPRSPAQSIQSVVLGSWKHGPTTLTEGTDYWVDTSCEPARVRLQANQAVSDHDYLQVTYTAGYPLDATGTATVPALVRQSIRALVGHYYRNRGDVEAVIPRQIYDNVMSLRKYDFGSAV